MKRVVIIGAGGHGRVVSDIVRACGDEVVGFLDDCLGEGVLGTTNDWGKFHGCFFVIAIGDARVRQDISKRVNGRWYTAIHPTAVVAPSACIGEGTVVMTHAVVNSGSVVGNHCIINTGAIVEHDNVIADFSHISVGAKLGGNVKIGESTWIGIGATVINHVSICDNCMIGAGAVVIGEIKKKGTYIGVPARIIQ